MSESLMQDLINQASEDNTVVSKKKVRSEASKVANAFLQGDGIASNDYTALSDPNKTSLSASTPKGPAGLTRVAPTAASSSASVSASASTPSSAPASAPSSASSSAPLPVSSSAPRSAVPASAPVSTTASARSSAPLSEQIADDDKTVLNHNQAVMKKPEIEPEAQISVGPKSTPTPLDLKFGQAETLKYAQKRINELERDLENIRRSGEILTAANELSKAQVESLFSKIQVLEKVNFELRQANENELQMFKEALQQKDGEKIKLRNKVEELENRLSQDMRRIRVRERELENRLELARLEKTALVRTKDESILELKRKIDNLESELETYRNKIVELHGRIESNQEQFGRTVRALRLALANLESSDEETNINIPISAYKKAD